jgi:hypothetical protein
MTRAVDRVARVTDEHTEHDALHLRREALTMGLYVSITLLAALTATDDAHGSYVDVFAIVWGTTVGLALAHWCAFSLATRLVDPRADHHILTPALAAQLGAAASVALVATLAIIVFPDEYERSGARLAAAGCITFVTYGETRSFGASRPRALIAAGIALAIASVVAGIKHGISH